jgi:hypothetical protein
MSGFGLPPLRREGYPMVNDHLGGAMIPDEHPLAIAADRGWPDHTAAEAMAAVKQYVADRATTPIAPAPGTKLAEWKAAGNPISDEERLRPIPYQVPDGATLNLLVMQQRLEKDIAQANGIPPRILLSADNCGFLKMPNATEVRPPPEHADKPFHFLSMPSRGFEFEPCLWWKHEGSWSVIGEATLATPQEMASYGWRYLGPAEWHEPPSGDMVSDPFPHWSRESWVQHAERLKQAAIAIRQTSEARIAELEAENAMHRAHPPLTGGAVPGKPYRWNAVTGRWEEGTSAAADFHADSAVVKCYEGAVPRIKGFGDPDAPPATPVPEIPPKPPMPAGALKPGGAKTGLFVP